MRKLSFFCLFLAMTMNVFASGKFVKTEIYKNTAVAFTWDCYGDVPTIEAALDSIEKEVSLKTIAPDLTFKLDSTVIDDNRRHYYYHGYNAEGHAMSYSMFEIHAISQGNSEVPYFVCGGVEKEDRSYVDIAKSLIPEFKVPEGTMKSVEVETFYSGKQKIDYLETADGTGYLYDTERNIYTLDACDYIFNKYPDEIQSLTKDHNLDKGVTATIQYSKPYTTHGDLFQTGYKPFKVACDSLYFTFGYMQNESEFTAEEMDLTLVFQDNITHDKTTLYTDHIVNEDPTSFDIGRRLKLSSAFEIAHPNWSIYLVVNQDTVLFNQSEFHSLNYCPLSEFKKIGPSDFKESELTFSAILFFQPKEVQPALDAHMGMQKIQDAYKDVLGYVNSDVTYQLCNVGDRFTMGGHNAGMAFNSVYGKTVTAYGFGGKTPGYHFYMPVVAMSTIGHEYTHLFQHYLPQGALKYHLESGALNESFADIIGLSLEWIALHGTESNPDWHLSHNSIISRDADISMLADIIQARDSAVSFRNFKDSEGALLPQPVYYMGDYYITEEEESRDGLPDFVHNNSGVHNHWYYLMVEGGDKTIPFVKALKFVYETLKYYSFPLCNYQHVYNIYKAAAKYQCLDGIPFGSVDDNQYLMATTDNWHKCGVGLGQDVTGISNPTTDSLNNNAKDTRKVMEDGQIILIKNGVKYNVAGQRL